MNPKDIHSFKYNMVSVIILNKICLQIKRIMYSERSNSATHFCVQKNIAKPIHLLFNRKVNNLESKVQFFQGQVDPLHLENVSLKQQLMALSKIVNSSTDLLRNLLPTQGHPAKKLKLQLANLTQISDMIKTDWIQMQKTLAQNAETIKTLTHQRNHWNQQYQQECILRKHQVKEMEESKAQMKQHYEKKVSCLRREISDLLQTHQHQKQKMKNEFQRRLDTYDSTLKQYQMFKYDTRIKNGEYEKQIDRLKGEIQANLISFEQGKKNLKEIYDKLMNDKLKEQAEGYDLMLKLKEDQKMSLLMQMNEIQQQHKRKTALKQLEIKKINDFKTSLQQEIGGLKNELWSKQLCIDKQDAQNKALQQNITNRNLQNQELKKNIQINQENYSQQKRNLQDQIRKQKIEMEMIKKQGSSAMAKILDEKQKLEKQLSEKIAQNKNLTTALTKSEAQFNSKMAKMKDQWEKQAQILKQQIEKRKQELQKERIALKHSKLLLEEQSKQHQQSVKKLKKSFKEKEQEMAAQYQHQMTKFRNEAQENYQCMKRKLELDLKQAQIAANQEMRLLMVQCNKKLTQQAEQYYKQMQQMKQQGQKLQDLLSKAEEQIQNKIMQAERLKYQHQKELERVNQQNELQKQKMTEQMVKQMKQFQRSLEQKEAELSSIRADMENEIKMLKEANAIQSIEQRFQSEINKLKEQFSDRCREIQENNKQKMQTLLNLHEQKIKTMTQEHNNNLNHIAEKVQNTRSFIDDHLLTGEDQVDMHNISQEQKKGRIISKINNLKAGLVEKDNKIAQLEENLAEVQRTIQKRIKARKEELEIEKEQVIKNCDKKIGQITQDCNNKVKKIEKDRIEHTTIMYSEFQALKQHHQHKFVALYEKYKTLQKLFEERPSRAQDLTKIKQLINLQTKMDIQIQSYQKRMETANQIVKYLNLQLQNYKDAYDIFGPNGDKKEVGIIGQGFKQREPSSNHSLNQSQNLIDAIKARKHERYQSEGKLQDKKQLRQPPSLQKYVNSPTIKELKIFEGDSDKESVDLSILQKKTKQQKYSNLFSQDKSKLLKQRFKTEKSQKIEKGDNQNEIIINAQNFIRLIKSRKEENPVLKEQDENFTKKSYRKRKLGKKHPTIAHEHYF